MDLYVDIETIPGQSPELKQRIQETIKPPGTIKKPESIERWYEENLEAETDKAWRKTSLNGTVGEISCIGWAINDEPARVIGRTLEEPENILLVDFFLQLRQALMQPHSTTLIKPTWIGHFITGFDLRFIWQRCIINRVIPTVRIPYNAKPWDTTVYDTKVEWTGQTSYSGYGSQDAICKALGFAGKGDIDGSKVWDYIKAGRYAEVENYCIEDVEDNRRMHKAMTFR